MVPDSNERAVRGRAIRFRLRTILIGTTFVAALLGIYSRSFRNQTIVAQAVRHYGGRAYYDFQETPRGSGDFDARVRPNLPQWLVAMFGEDFFFNVVAVEIAECDAGQDEAFWTDALARLAPLRRVRQVTLCGRRASDDALAQLCKMPAVEELRLLNACRVTNGGIAVLASLPRLRKLHITRSRITDTSLQVVSRIMSLEDLVLDGNHITDEGMAYVGRLSQLTFLSLNDTHITSCGLQRLKDLKKLRSLYVARTRADTTDVEQALPACCVVPSTQLRDGDARHSLSVERLAERMIMLCGAPGVDSAFYSQRIKLEAFLTHLRRRSRDVAVPLDESYRELTRLIEPRDLSMQLRLSAAHLEWADRSIDTIKELEEEKETHGLTAAELKQYADELSREELLLDEAAEYLGLRAAMTPQHWRSVVADLCKRTRPALNRVPASLCKGPELNPPAQHAICSPGSGREIGRIIEGTENGSE